MSWSWQGDGTVVLVAMLAACACALVGNFLVLRRMSLMGDAISHAVLPGLVIAFLMTHSRGIGAMLLGAVVVGALTALLTQAVARYGKVEEGAAMGVVFTILFAIGLVLIRQAADHVDLDPGCVLYGNINHIYAEAMHGTPVALINLSIVFGVNVLFVLLFFKELKISSFDPSLSTTLGINADVMHYVLMILVALTAVVSFEAVGSILVIAMLIVPPVTAHLLTNRLGVMVVLSAAFAAASAILAQVSVIAIPSWVGSSIQPDTSAVMTVIAGLFLFIAIVVAPERGVLSRVSRQFALAVQIRREDILGLLYRHRELATKTSPSLRRSDILTVFGKGLLTRYAIRSLFRHRMIETGPTASDSPAMNLTEKGLRGGQRLVRSHRLWESYIAANLGLPLDHLHMPAERVEHYITPELDGALESALESTESDPHGRSIPTSGEGPDVRK